MKLIWALMLLMSATLAAAQPAVQALPAPATAPAVWNPAAPYITAGQDEIGYRSWYLSAPAHAAAVRSFNDYLTGAGVAGILPTWQLLRTASSWQECGGQPFEVPPSTEWPNIIQTLRYVRDYVVPRVGPVEAVSVYRNPSLNSCAGGAPESAHMLDSAIDMVPLTPIDRVTLIRELCSDHSQHGDAYKAGLGFYAYLRFHIDSIKFRRWNMDPAVASECPAILHPGDAASAGQPIAAQAPPAIAPPAAPAATPPPTAIPGSGHPSGG